MRARKTEFTINPAPMVRMLTVSLRIAARMKKVIIAPQMNRTRSTGGILSDNPDMMARYVGINAECSRTIPIHPIDSAVLGLSFLSMKCPIHFLIFNNRVNQSTLVEDVFSNLGDSFSFPLWGDVVRMVK